MSNRRTTLFYAVLISAVSIVIGMVIASRLELSPTSSAQTFTAAPPMNSAPLTGPVDAQTFRGIAKTQTPMVVNIRTESRRRTQELTDFFGGDDMLRRFFGQPDMPGQPGGGGQGRPREEVTEGAGSGFIIDKSGLILTNNHVVEGATKIEVALFGEEEAVYKAKVLGRDQLTDSALIQLVDKPNHALPEATFGDSDQMQPGDWVVAIGNPFNLSHTVTVGVVSAIGRAFPVAEGRWQNVLQTDAAINPGNSGGPLLNVRGEVIGINTAIYSDQSRAANLGIGFAMPINAVRTLLPQLRAGKVTRGRIGVTIQPVRAEAVEQFGLKDKKGAVVGTVEANGPSAKAGLQPGDVILEFNGRAVNSSNELVQMVMDTKPGTTVPVRVIRDKQPRTFSITVGELDLDAEVARTTENVEDNTATGFGMTLNDLTSELTRRLRMPAGSTGVIVTEVDPNGAAARVGVHPGDVLLEVNRKPVANVSEASRALQAVESGKVAFLLIWRGGQEMFLTVKKE